MRVQQLRTYNLPDVGDHLIHFTGRDGGRINVPQEIVNTPPQERLLQILVDRVIRAIETFAAAAPVVCFTESTKGAVTQLIHEGRYAPCGIGFSKQQIFTGDGGPVLYVRGDEWERATQALPQPLRSRLVRFWPGATPDPGEILPSYLLNQSEWLQEREWRVPGDFQFDWPDVKFLIVPHAGWQGFYADWIEDWAGGEYAAYFRQIPAVVMDQAGNVLSDAHGVWG